MEKVSLQDENKLAFGPSFPLAPRFPPAFILSFFNSQISLLVLLVLHDKLTLAKVLIGYYFPFPLERSSSVKAKLKLGSKEELLKLQQASDIHWACHSG